MLRREEMSIFDSADAVEISPARVGSTLTVCLRVCAVCGYCDELMVWPMEFACGARVPPPWPGYRKFNLWQVPCLLFLTCVYVSFWVVAFVLLAVPILREVLR